MLIKNGKMIKLLNRETLEYKEVTWTKTASAMNAKIKKFALTEKYDISIVFYKNWETGDTKNWEVGHLCCEPGQMNNEIKATYNNTTVLFTEWVK